MNRPYPANTVPPEPSPPTPRPRKNKRAPGARTGPAAPIEPSDLLLPDASEPESDADTDASEAAELALVCEIQTDSTNSAAWGTLLEKYQDRLYAVCLRMVSSPDAAADLTQDAMVKIIQGLSSYDARSKLSTWMIRVTMNTCLSYLRSQKLRRHASLDAVEEGRDNFFRYVPDELSLGSGVFPGGPGGSGGSLGGSGIGRFVRGGGADARSPSEQNREQSPGANVEDEEAKQRVLAGLATLPAEQRALLVLRDVQGLDYERIASVLEVAVGTVKSRLFRARAALRQAVETGNPAKPQGFLPGQ